MNILDPFCRRHVRRAKYVDCDMCGRASARAVKDRSEEGKTDKRGEKGDDHTEDDHGRDKSVGVTRHKKPSGRHNVKQYCTESDDITFHITKNPDVGTALLENMTGKSRMTTTDVDGHEEKKLKRMKKILR